MGGDEIVIWTHEGKGYGSGLGLTARARIAAARPSGHGTHIRLEAVELLSPHLHLHEIPEGRSGSDAIEAIRGYTLYQLVYLSADEATELMAALDRLRGAKATTLRDLRSEDRSPAAHALSDEAEELRADFDRRFSLREARLGQPAFRAVLVGVYGGRCVVTGCDVEDVLEACHIASFARHVDLRESARNGLLLRADIHALFDRLRLSIHPRNGQVVLAPPLRSSAYGRLHGRVVRHRADPELLGAHFRSFLDRWPEPPEHRPPRRGDTLTRPN